MKRIVVLGAGITGLAAAERLVELGSCEVTVLEAEHSVGGLAATIHFDGVATDIGPHRLHTELPEVGALWHGWLGERLVQVRRSSRMLLDGRWIDYPLRPLDLARSLRLPRILRLAASFAAARATATFSTEAARTFEACMKRQFGVAAYRSIFEPYARKVWRADPARLSAEIARVRLPAGRLTSLFRAGRSGPGAPASGPLQTFLYVEGGIGILAHVLAERVERAGGRILLDSSAVGLLPGDRGIGAVQVLRSGRLESLPCDAVISTIPLPSLAQIVPALDRERLSEATSRLEYLSLILVAIVVAKERIGHDQWLYFPQTPPLAIRACEPKNFDCSMSPPDKSCLCCEITSRPDEPVYTMADAEIAESVASEMEALGLFAPAEIVSAHVIRKDWAYPAYALGFEKILEDLWPRLAALSNLVSVGRQGLFSHNNIDHCIVMGRRAAELVAVADSPARSWYQTLDQFSDFRIFD